MPTKTQTTFALLVTAVAAYWAGHVTTAIQEEVAVLVDGDDVGTCPPCAAWTPCADCPACPPPAPLALHQKTLEARCGVRVADAYVRGIEDARDLAKSCDYALEALQSCNVAECQEPLWEIEFSLMNVGMDTMLRDNAVSHWSMCCEELLRKWPEPPGEYGEYPANFPGYCQ